MSEQTQREGERMAGGQGEDRDYPVEVIAGLVESLDRIDTLLKEYEENVGETPRLELAYVVDRFDEVVRTLHAARTREIR